MHDILKNFEIKCGKPELQFLRVITSVQKGEKSLEGGGICTGLENRLDLETQRWKEEEFELHQTEWVRQ